MAKPPKTGTPILANLFAKVTNSVVPGKGFRPKSRVKVNGSRNKYATKKGARKTA